MRAGLKYGIEDGEVVSALSILADDLAYPEARIIDRYGKDVASGDEKFSHCEPPPLRSLCRSSGAQQPSGPPFGFGFSLAYPAPAEAAGAAFGYTYMPCLLSGGETGHLLF